MNALHKDMYDPKGLKPPVIHCIGYQIDREGHSFLQSLSKTYHGEYRRVRRMR